MGTVIRAIIAIVVIVVAWKLLKGVLGLIVGVVIAAIIFVAAKNMLTGGSNNKRIGGPDAR
jgi:predicted PurR-regulated permease PerM